MRTGKGFFLAATVASVVFLLVGIGTLRAKPDKPDPHKPVTATDSVLVKKITLRGGRPAGVGGGKKKAGAATGILEAPCSGKKYAVVVGISDYPGTFNDLQYAAADADDVTRALNEVYHFDSVITLTDGGATRSAIMDAIATMGRQAGPDDEVVFFFSGHGMSGVADDGDTERMDEAIVTQEYGMLAPIWDGELKTAFSNFQTSRIIFIFDSCLAGGMDVLQEPGRVVLMASSEKGYAYEGDEWHNGEFTYYLVEGITSGGANIHDYDHDGRLSEPAQVTTEEAYDYAKANCVADNPVIADDFTGDLLP